MTSTPSQPVPTPPSLMKALMAGFDAISNHIELILFSVVLDLFLWLGPRWSEAELFRGFLDPAALEKSAAAVPELQGQANEVIAQLSTLAQGFNLFSFLRTFPVGVPSLVAGQLALENPLGGPMGGQTGPSSVWELASFPSASVFWLLSIGIGLGLGTLYFLAVAQAAITNQVSWRDLLRQWPWACFQAAGLSMIWLVIVALLLFPLSCFMSVFLLSGLGMGQVSLFIFLFAAVVVVWLLVPLVFAPHAIFVHRYPAWAAIRESIRLTRMTLPSTTMLLLVVVLLNEGLNVLWNVPPASSWLLLIGILGHAFVVTSLLAASFVYYQDADSWVREVFKQTRLSSTA